MDKIEEPPKPVIAPAPANLPKPKKSNAPQKESFVSWLQKNRPKLEEEFPGLDSNQLMKTAFARFKETPLKENGVQASGKDAEDEANKKRKPDEPADENNQPKRSAISKLAAFARND